MSLLEALVVLALIVTVALMVVVRARPPQRSRAVALIASAGVTCILSVVLLLS